MSLKNWSIILSYLICTSGCISYKNIVNYSHDLSSEPHDIKNPPAIIIQPNDVLDIKVFAADIAAAAPF
ncbi:MAG: hypothetical protein IPL46_04950 [Saprospiraceae bacterium]|nr:hypothetical protein [Saprospiraceae bacterium]